MFSTNSHFNEASLDSVETASALCLGSPHVSLFTANSCPRAGASALKACALIPAAVLARIRDAGIRIHLLPPGTKYREASAELRRLGIDVDNWPVPPSGLTVLTDRTVYIRVASEMTVVHELGHAFDYSLGAKRLKRQYFSSESSEIKYAFAMATKHVTPYAASDRDEYFAECFRAMFAANDDESAWPKVSPERLRAIDPRMFDIMSRLLELQ